MTDFERLEQELSEKEKIFDEKYISGKDDYLSEEAEKMRQDIWSLRFKITDLKEKRGKTADELFEELGYKKIVGETTEVYKLSRANKNIYFSKLIKRIKIDGKYDFLDMEELRAINKKCKELGWI